MAEMQRMSLPGCQFKENTFPCPCPCALQNYFKRLFVNAPCIIIYEIDLVLWIRPSPAPVNLHWIVLAISS